MLTTVVESAIGKLGGPFSRAFLGQPCRKEMGDRGVVRGRSGNVYKLESVLGIGGLSVVYKAIRVNDGQAVALKVADVQKAPEAQDLLKREAQLMERLQHHNIVKLYEAGATTDGDPFIAMEILEGQTLEQVLIAETYLDAERVLSIALQVAAAVQYAHEKGILHRDIKPSNIMLMKRNGFEKVVVFDFGISLPVGEDGNSLDQTSSGSLLYASPEQLKEQTSTYNTDVYQLALVMFEAMTGRLPFEISISGAIAYRKGPGPVLLSDAELGEQRLFPAVRCALESALQRDNRKRTQNMRSFLQELEFVWEEVSSIYFHATAV